MEALARLVDEPPSPQESRHLEACARCREELLALREQTEALAALPDLCPPVGHWESLERRLVDEGLVRPLQRVRSRRGPGWGVWGRVAAGLVLFLAGSWVGSWIGGKGGEMGPVAGVSVAELPGVEAGPGAQPVETLEEAAAWVRQAEREYLQALVRYRQLLEAQGELPYRGHPAARLAALQGIVAAGRAGVEQAPADPFLNGVLVGALAEQEVLLRTVAMAGFGDIF